MLKKRIIVCLDVKNGRVTKGVNFKNNKDIGDPSELAFLYYNGGADELVFYDITASLEHRSTMCNVVKEVAKHIYIPFTVGGGVSSIDDMHMLLHAGAEKISVNSLAVLNPTIITEGAKKFGNQCMVLGVDALADDAMPSGYRVVIRGGTEYTNKDVLTWVMEAQDRGVGEIILNSINSDGIKKGYECKLTKMISTAVCVPVVASGGAGTPEHLEEVLTKGCADAALIASMVHYGSYTLSDIKTHLFRNKIDVRL